MSYDLTNAVLLRPEMYTTKGSFLEVVAFLEGYYSGIAKDPRALATVEKWGNFQEFLKKKLDNHSSNKWAILYNQYGEQALRVFKTYYEEFCQSQNSS